MNDRFDLQPPLSFSQQLRRKSRARREAQERLAQASISRHRRNDLLPRLELKYVALSDVRPSPKRMRVVDPTHLREVRASIAALGFCDPLLLGRGNELLNGEARYQAARELGLDRAPCVRIDHLSEEEQRVLRLAVNRLSEKGQWDLDALKVEFEELILTDAPIEVAGFTLDEIDHIVLDKGDAGLEEGPLEPDPSAAPVAKIGDVFSWANI